MDIKEFKSLDKKALQEELVKYKREYFNLRFQKFSSDSFSPAKIKEVKKNIARIKTVFNNN